MPRQVLNRSSQRRRRRRRRLIVVVVLVVVGLVVINLWTLFGERHLTARVREILDARLAYPYELDRVRFGLLDGLTIENLRIESPKADAPHQNMVEVETIHLEFALRRWLTGGSPIRRVTLSHPQVYVAIEEDLSSPLARILRPADDASADLEIPEIVVEDLEVRTCPQSLFQMKEPLEVDHFSLTLYGDEEYRFSGTAKYPLVRRVRVSGTGDREDHTFEGKIDVTRVLLDETVRERLPERFRSVWDEYRPTGMANASLDFSLSEGRIADWRVEVEIIEASMQLAEPPLALSSVHGSVEILPESDARRLEGDALAPPSALRSPGRLRTLTPLRGRAFGGEAKIEGGLEFHESEVVADSIHVELDHMPLEEQTRQLLRGPLRDAFDQLRPQGFVSIDLTVSGPDTVLTVDELELEEVTIVPTAFPYPIERVSGVISRSGDRYSVRLDGGAEGTPLRARGHFGLAPTSSLQLELRVERLLADAEIRDALPEGIRQVWELLQPGGVTDFEIRLARESGSSDALLEVELDPTAAFMRYQHFPYTISDIRGRVTVLTDIRFGEQVEAHAREVRLEQLRGSHGDSEVFCDVGEIRFQPFSLDLRLRSPSVAIERDILSALPDEAASFLRGCNLDGRLKTGVMIAFDEERHLEVEVTTEVVPPVRMRYHALPYPLTFLKGTTTYTLSDHSTRFEGLETDPALGPRIRVSGHANPGEEEGEQRNFFLIKVDPGNDVPGLDVSDPVLLESLPTDVRNLLQKLAVVGFATCDLLVDYTHYAQVGDREERQSVDYEGQVEVHDGGCRIGVSVEEIETTLSISGTAGPRPEDNHRFSVLVDGGRFRFSRFLVKDVDASFYYGEEHPIIASGPTAGTGETYLPDAQFYSRLRGPNQTKKALQAYIRDADVYGGSLRGFFFVDVDRNKDFMGSYLAEGIDLSIGGGEIFKSEGIQGRADGEVIFSGAIDAPDRLWGEGRFGISNARLTQIPLMANVLRNPLFGLFEGLDREQNFVREVRGNFTIEPNRFRVHDYGDLELKTGSGVTFRGKGSLDFDLNIDMLLEPQGSLMGLPGLSTIFNKAFRMRLDGPLDDPKSNFAGFQ
ncbi:MAG: hypothetical protein KDC38_02930 [Planctomycetes bacterium]|nr:hypothetical protein [Planctomycetota bacterium]